MLLKKILEIVLFLICIFRWFINNFIVLFREFFLDKLVLYFYIMVLISVRYGYVYIYKFYIISVWFDYLLIEYELFWG